MLAVLKEKLSLGVAVTVLLLPAPIILTTCAPLYNIIEAPQLRSHVTAVCRSRGTRIEITACQMIGTTRCGFCEFTASAREIESLVKGLALEEPDAVKQAICFSMLERNLSELGRNEGRRWGEHSSIRLRRGPGSGYRLAQEFIAGGDIKIYISARKIRGAGQAFSEFWLLYKPATGEACIRACYAYG